MWKSQNTRFIFSPEAAAESLPTCSKESRQSAPSKSWSTREPSSACASRACRSGTTCGRSEQTIQSAPECSQTYANTATRLSLPGAFRARMFHAREKARAYAAREADFGRKAKRFHSFCEKFQSRIQGMCSPQCPCKDCCDKCQCLIKWAQTPYEEGGAK